MNLFCDLDLDSLATRAVMIRWLTDNLGDRDDMWSCEGSQEIFLRYRFYFRHEQDLTMFLLRWS